MRRVLFTALALLLPVVPGVGGVADAAATTHEVQAGAVHPTNPLAPYEYTRYYPSEVRVHRGDTVEWSIAFQKSIDLAFHSVTFLGSNTAKRAPFARAEEVPGEMAFAEGAWERSEKCGLPDEPVCVLTQPGQVLSSGVLAIRAVPPPTFRVQFELPVGRYRYLCSIHAPMVGFVNVVPPRAPLRNPSRAQIDREIARDTAAMDAVIARYSKPSAATVDGQRVWTVTMEPRTRDSHVAALGYYPTNLKVRAGDRVRWVAQGGEIHTVAFPAESKNPPGPSFFPRCDPDSPTSGAFGIPYPGLDCPFGATEVGMGPGLTAQQRAPGDAVTTQATVHSSGIIAEPSGSEHSAVKPDGSRWPIEFAAAFPRAGTFGYACQVHTELPMVGSVVVE